MINSIAMGEMVMSEQKYNGSKASISGGGQSQTFLAGDPVFEEMKGQTTIFDQLNYGSPDFKVELKGIEKFDGINCYKILVKKGDKSETQFYAVKSSLLMATSQTKGEGENAQTIITAYGDYKDVNGLMMPHTMNITGAAPFPLPVVVKEYQFNVDIPDSDFDIK